VGAQRPHARIVMALLVLLVVAPLAGSGQQRFDRRLPTSVERTYLALSKTLSGPAAMEVVTFMAKYWRLAGNPGFEASQELIAQRLAAAGFTVVPSAAEAQPRTSGSRPTPAGYLWYEEFPNTGAGWEPVSARMSLVEGAAAGEVLLDSARQVDAVSLCINSFSTPEGGTRAPLVVVGRGTAATDYANVDVKGRIVLGEADARRLYDMAVRQRGAAGVLSTATALYTRPQETPDVLEWSGIPYDEATKAFGFKISSRLAARLKERLAAGPVTLAVDIVSRFHRRPNRTLVAEIPGRSKPGERVVLAAHVQEPGANDNASGCATLLEIARGLGTAIARGAVPPPARTLTFLWGDEITESRQWLRADAARPASVRYAFSLDMTGEDVTKTGGAFLIEKQPDPSAVWSRPSDPHTEWGAGRVSAESLKGSLLNDLHLAICLRRARDTGWVVKENPYEGGSDHSVFIAAGVPALLDWHFTDRYYHTNLDTPDKTSAAEMVNVGVAVGTTAWLLAAATQEDALAVADVIEQAALDRLRLEARQSAAILSQHDDEATRATEGKVFAAWQKWYAETLQSVLALPVTEATAKLQGRVSRAIERVKAVRPAQD